MAVVNEAVAEVAEQVAEEALEVAEVSRSLHGTSLTIGLAFGGVIGAGACFLILRKKLEMKYNKFAEDEIEEMREHFQKRLIVREEKPDLSEEVKKVTDVVEREGYDRPNITLVEEDKDGIEVGGKEEVVEEVVVVEEVEGEETLKEELSNVFEETKKDANADWDYEEEVRLRRPERPYVIHVDEQHERGYTETSLTYYAGDDVLCDERDNVIEDPEQVVGVANLEKFGHGSGDKNIVYIRNDTLAIELEVVKNDDNFAEVVHGFVQHSEKDRQRRHRFDDESGPG